MSLAEVLRDSNYPYGYKSLTVGKSSAPRHRRLCRAFSHGLKREEREREREREGERERGQVGAAALPFMRSIFLKEGREQSWALSKT